MRRKNPFDWKSPKPTGRVFEADGRTRADVDWKGHIFPTSSILAKCMNCHAPRLTVSYGGRVAPCAYASGKIPRPEEHELSPVHGGCQKCLATQVQIADGMRRGLCLGFPKEPRIFWQDSHFEHWEHPDGTFYVVQKGKGLLPPEFMAWYNGAAYGHRFNHNFECLHCGLTAEQIRIGQHEAWRFGGGGRFGNCDKHLTEKKEPLSVRGLTVREEVNREAKLADLKLAADKEEARLELAKLTREIECLFAKVHHPERDQELRYLYLPELKTQPPEVNVSDDPVIVRYTITTRAMQARFAEKERALRFEYGKSGWDEIFGKKEGDKS